MNSISRFGTKLLEFLDTLRMMRAVSKNEPVSFAFRGRTYFVNPDRSAVYHIRNSTAKIARMVELIPSDARVIFDVGGNCGLFSAFAEKRCPDATIHCFEPSASLVPYIRKNVHEERVKLHELAVGEHTGTLELYVNEGSQQTNSANKSAVELFASPDEIRTEVVRCTSLDNFAGINGIDKVDVLKVDVQGFEGAVFRGGGALLPAVELLFVESTWMEIESITEIIPLALRYGFTHLGIVNPVQFGADIVLSRQELESTALELSFPVTGELVRPDWG